MPDERTSPSGGWREVYREMHVSTRIESEDGPRCPECGRPLDRSPDAACDHPEHGERQPEREDAGPSEIEHGD